MNPLAIISYLQAGVAVVQEASVLLQQIEADAAPQTIAQQQAALQAAHANLVTAMAAFNAKANAA